MDKKMNFKYFYGTEADQFSFYTTQKEFYSVVCNFITEILYEKRSIENKIEFMIDA